MELDIAYLIGVLRRRWWLLALPLVVGSALAAGIAYILPPVYSSTARILVESQAIPTDLARSTVSATADERIQLIEQRLTTRQNLLEIADRFNLYAGLAFSPSEIVDEMRDAIRIRSVGLAQRGPRGDVTVSTVNISFESHSPVLATRVANELLTRVLEQNIQQRNARAGETLDFFNQEVERLGAALTDVEARLSAFKRENDAALPDSLTFRREELVRIQDTAFQRETRRVALEEQRRSLEQQLESGLALGDGQSPLGAQLSRLRNTLAEQRGVFSDSHPSIRSLEARIAALEANLAAPEVASDADPDEPEPISTERATMLRQIELIDAQLRLLDQQQETDAERAVELRESIARTPAVEIELSELARERMALQTQYQEAILKQAQAQTGERLEVNRQAERFEVIEQPQTPERPDSPNRPLIAMAGVVASGGLGFALMVLAELLHRVLRTPSDLERQLQLRPVVTIPYISTASELRRRRWTIRAALFVVLVLLPLSLWLVDQYYLPLPLIAERLIEKTGFDGMISLIELRLGL